MVEATLPDVPLSADYLALRCRIERRYPIAWDCENLGGLELSVARVAEPDRVLNDIRHSAPDQQPYWARAWPSARALATVLCRQVLAGQRVLDLGCGVGLTGAAAAACGAEVLLADVVRPALLFARLNCWRWRTRVSVRRIDWRTDRRRGRPFDLIAGADILYDDSDWPFLEAFWLDWGSPTVRVVLTEPTRHFTDAFPGWLQDRGWQVRTENLLLPGANAIRLFEAQRTSACSV